MRRGGQRELLRQHGRLLLRVDALEQALAAGARSTGLLAVPLRTGHDVRTTAGALRREGLPLMLVFSDPGCGPCRALAPELGQWQAEHRDRLTIAVVAYDEAAADAFGVHGTPSAVLLGNDGRPVGEPAGGAPAIRELLRRGLDRPGRLLPVHHVRPDAIAAPVQDAGQQPGDRAPTFALPGLDGPISSEDLRGHPTLLLFWNPACGFCARMLDQIRRLDADPRAPRLVVISTDDAAAGRAMDLAAPVALDADFAVAGSFGATGTPSAVLLDSEGHVASRVAVGAAGVLALAGSDVVAA